MGESRKGRGRAVARAQGCRSSGKGADGGSKGADGSSKDADGSGKGADGGGSKGAEQWQTASWRGQRVWG